MHGLYLIQLPDFYQVHFGYIIAIISIISHQNLADVTDLCLIIIDNQLATLFYVKSSSMTSKCYCLLLSTLTFEAYVYPCTV